MVDWLILTTFYLFCFMPRGYGIAFIVYYSQIIFWDKFMMFSTSLATLHFHFVLSLTLLDVGQNHLKILSSQRREDLPSSHFQSLKYHSTTTWVHLLSLNLVRCPAQWRFKFYDHVLHSTTISNYHSLDLLTQLYALYEHFFL